MLGKYLIVIGLMIASFELGLLVEKHNQLRFIFRDKNKKNPNKFKNTDS